MTTASCSDYSLLTAPPPGSSDCSRMRAGPVTALLYDDFDASSLGVMPLHHHRSAGAAYNNLARGYTPNDLRHHQQQLMQQQQLSSSSSYHCNDRQSSTFHDSTRQQLAGCTAVPPAESATEHTQYADASASPYQAACTDARYNSYVAPSSCLQPPPAGIGGGVQRPMTQQPEVLSPESAYSPYSARCLQSSARGDLLMRTMPGPAGGCCISGYCAPSGSCHCSIVDQLYDHHHDQQITLNGGGHVSAEHVVSCRLQHQQRHPHQSAAGTYKWMMIKRSTPKTTPSGLLLCCIRCFIETYNLRRILS